MALVGTAVNDKGACCFLVLDESTYVKGMKIADKELAAIQIIPVDFHGNWNCIIALNDL